MPSIESELRKKREPKEKAWRKEKSERRIERKPRVRRGPVPPEQSKQEARSDQKALQQILE